MGKVMTNAGRPSLHVNGDTQTTLLREINKREPDRSIDSTGNNDLYVNRGNV